MLRTFIVDLHEILICQWLNARPSFPENNQRRINTKILNGFFMQPSHVAQHIIANPSNGFAVHLFSHHFFFQLFSFSSLQALSMFSRPSNHESQINYIQSQKVYTPSFATARLKFNRKENGKNVSANSVETERQRWINAAKKTTSNNYVKLFSPSCSSSCGLSHYWAGFCQPNLRHLIMRQKQTVV